MQLKVTDSLFTYLDLISKRDASSSAWRPKNVERTVDDLGMIEDKEPINSMFLTDEFTFLTMYQDYTLSTFEVPQSLLIDN